MLIQVADNGPGLPVPIWVDGKISDMHRTEGLHGSQRLVDAFRIATEPGKGATVSMEMLLRTSQRLTAADISQRMDELFRRQPQNPHAELEQQNRDMLHTLLELRERKNDLEIADKRKNEFVGEIRAYAQHDCKHLEGKGRCRDVSAIAAIQPVSNTFAKR